MGSVTHLLSPRSQSRGERSRYPTSYDDGSQELVIGYPFLGLFSCLLSFPEVFTTCYSWFSHSLLIRKVGNGVNILKHVLRGTCGVPSYTLFRILLVKTSVDCSVVNLSVYNYLITPTQYSWSANSIARIRTVSFRAVATIAFFLLPEFFHTLWNLSRRTGSKRIARQTH
jgi:hypothetical protein